MHAMKKDVHMKFDNCIDEYVVRRLCSVMLLGLDTRSSIGCYNGSIQNLDLPYTVPLPFELNNRYFGIAKKTIFRLDLSCLTQSKHLIDFTIIKNYKSVANNHKPGTYNQPNINTHVHHKSNRHTSSLDFFLLSQIWPFKHHAHRNTKYNNRLIKTSGRSKRNHLNRKEERIIIQLKF